MKYFTRLGLYKASNVTFDLKAMAAISYGWWHFVREIEGKLVFNEHRYSPTTGKHQRKVRALLREIGLTIDVTVDTPDSLHRFDTMDGLLNAHRQELRNKAGALEEKRISRNTKARTARALKRSALANPGTPDARLARQNRAVRVNVSRETSPLATKAEQYSNVIPLFGRAR